MNPTLQLIDVFGAAPFQGNPLAVVQGAAHLSTERMLQITRWLNFSETTFVGPADDPAADYRVRIFTPERELPFAGHPTLGSCHAWLSTGGQPRHAGQVVQQCGAGLVSLRTEGGRLAFAAPPLLRSGGVEEDTVQALAAFLGIARDSVVDAAWGDNGPGWIMLLLASDQAVRKLEPQARSPRPLAVGVVGPAPAGTEHAFELRAFFTDQLGNVREDPVTGSLNAAVGQWLFASGRARGQYVAAQGSCLGRAGRIQVSQDAQGQVWVGGNTATIGAPATLAA